MKISNLRNAEDLIVVIEASLNEARDKGLSDGAELVAVYLIDNHFPENREFVMGRLGMTPERYQEIQNL